MKRLEGRTADTGNRCSYKPFMAHDHSHDHDHDHGHHHGHGHHSHAPASFGRAFAVGAALNVGFVLIEAVYGLISGSVALLADAGHNLGDVLGLLTAWGASRLALRQPSDRYTYGLRSSSMLAALFNATTLLLVTGGVVTEAVRRLFMPGPVAGPTVMVVAAIGILINGATAAMFASGRKGDINIRGAFLHMLSDAVVSAGVVAAGALIWVTGWAWVDAAVSLGISALIIWGTWGLLRESLNMVLHAVPDAIEPRKVRDALGALPGVSALHDLHIWPMSTTETALTCHLVMPGGHPGDAFLAEACQMLQTRYKIGHSTLQVEIDEGFACPLEPDHVV
jgi:cobalt-zinc-cadmium efflux system protein